MTDPTIEETAALAPVEPPLDEVRPNEDDDPDQLVATAEAEEHEAEALVEALEARFVDGDETVGQDTIEKQRGLAAFAKLHVQRAKVKRDRIKAARRQAAAEQIVAEIEVYEPGIRKKVTDKLRAIERAEDALLTITEEHDAKVRDWRLRATALNIPEHDGRPLPPAVDGRLALGTGYTAGGFGVALRAGRRNIETISGTRLLTDFKINSRGALTDASDRAALIRSIEGGIEEQPEPAQDTVFFKNRATGATFQFAPDAPTLEHIRTNPDMTQVSREEALGS